MTPESPLSDSPRLKLYYAVFGLVSTLVVRVFGYRRAVMRGNLERSFPDLPAAARRDIEREFVRRQAEVLAEIAYAPHLTADELRRRVTVVNPQVLENARPPRPIVLAGAHQCNWEWMLLRVSLELGPQLLALYKPIRNPRVDAWFRNLRARFGANLIAAKSVLQELARFREARGIGLLADQVPKTSPEKHWLEFLHQDTAFYQGPELLARALRSQVVCIKVRRLARGRYEIEFAAVNEPGEKLAGGTLTERYARHLEAWIREDPAGWWWAHKRWKLKRPVY
jgi:KDO2-lipid IV(A) lauroyltransferase